MRISLRRLTPAQREVGDSLGYRFRNPALLDTALLHRSHRFENPAVDADNQRLEYLGDAVLGLIAADALYRRLPSADEGELSRCRASLTSGRTLARLARGIGLGERVRLGRGEEKTGGRTRESTLADAMEAVLGAAYLDGGLKAAGKIFDKVFAGELETLGARLDADNPKGLLQEMCQEAWQQTPSYEVVGESGPSHARLYEVTVCVAGRILGRGRGSSKRTAEAEAAQKAVETMARETRQGLTG